MPVFTEDDVGKTVVNPVGDEVGIVETVENGTPYVHPNPGLGEKIRTKLGWKDDPGMNEYPLDDEQIAEVTDDEIRLREDVSADMAGVE